MDKERLHQQISKPIGRGGGSTYLSLVCLIQKLDFDVTEAAYIIKNTHQIDYCMRMAKNISAAMGYYCRVESANRILIFNSEGQYIKIHFIVSSKIDIMWRGRHGEIVVDHYVKEMGECLDVIP